MAKDTDALLTIGELSAALGRPTHTLRYWETRVPALRPLQRAGGRRHYRPADVALARRIHSMLEDDGYTLDGVARALTSDAQAAKPTQSATPTPPSVQPAVRAIRDRLATALAETA